MDLQVLVERESDVIADLRHTDRDRDLVNALRLREPMATECLVTRYGERAYRLAVRITGNGQDAEEVVQDAFWTVARKIDTFRGDVDAVHRDLAEVKRLFPDAPIFKKG